MLLLSITFPAISTTIIRLLLRMIRRRHNLLIILLVLWLRIKLMLLLGLVVIHWHLLMPWALIEALSTSLRPATFPTIKASSILVVMLILLLLMSVSILLILPIMLMAALTSPMIVPLMVLLWRMLWRHHHLILGWWAL